MLRIDVRELRNGPVATTGTIQASDPLLVGLDVALSEPLRVSGMLEATGHGDYYWRGHLEGKIDGTCRRCLGGFAMPLSTDVAAVFTADPDLQDDPAVYPLPEMASQVDLTGAIREELALSVSAYPLCREDCAGLCPRCGADLNLGPCECSVAQPDV